MFAEIRFVRVFIEIGVAVLILFKFSSLVQ